MFLLSLIENLNLSLFQHVSTNGNLSVCCCFAMQLSLMCEQWQLSASLMFNSFSPAALSSLFFSTYKPFIFILKDIAYDMSF